MNVEKCQDERYFLIFTASVLRETANEAHILDSYALCLYGREDRVLQAKGILIFGRKS